MTRTHTALALVALLALAGCSGSGGGASGASGGSVGFSAGGAQDANDFRSNIEAGYVPQPSALQYEGLFHDYYFDTGRTEACTELFCPSYSYAATRDPLSGEREEFLTVGLNSGLDETDFDRKKLNLVVVLDTSGSMDTPMSRYHSDGGRTTEAEESEARRSKMETATDSLATLTEHLRAGDRFGVVTYSDEARVVQDMEAVGETDMNGLRDRIGGIQAGGGTNLADGMDTAEEMVEPYENANSSEYETRVIYLTDAMPNLGDTSGEGLGGRIDSNAENGVFSTFVGIGVDFNTHLVETINSVRGANYYAVHSSEAFEERMDEGFAYMVSPLVFDLDVRLDASGYEVERVYGSPNADPSSGDVLSVNTLFPSRTKNDTTEGGVILLQLNRTSDDAGTPELTASYEDRQGERTTTTTEVAVPEGDAGSFESSGVRKAVLLARYGELVRNWAADERARAAGMTPDESLADGESTDFETWDQESVPLGVSSTYRERFERFEAYFAAERDALDDPALDREASILETLSGDDAVDDNETGTHTSDATYTASSGSYSSAIRAASVA